MDLGAVLLRRSEVAVVDEFAHSNVPGGGRNAKRRRTSMNSSPPASTSSPPSMCSVSAMHGTLTPEDTPGGGLTMVVSIPLAERAVQPDPTTVTTPDLTP